MTLPTEINLLLAGNQGGYQISRSVRLRSSVTAYLNRTPAVAGNRGTWTYSNWVKRGTLSVGQILFGCTISEGNEFTVLNFNSANTLQFSFVFGGVNQWSLGTTQVFRDPSAWYHIVAVADTGNAIAADRIRLYINGMRVTAFSSSTLPSLGANSNINSTNLHAIGRYGSSQYFDGYLTEINLIDGQALTPTSFGEFNAITGVWQPKKYAGTYGTNGFYLNFSDNSAATAAAIGKDYSGNGNNWTPNNISVTAGVTYDSMIDTPTPYADGGNGRGNYATWSPIVKGTSVIVSNGNLDASWSGTAGGSVYSTIALPKTGKWYCEMTGAYQVCFGLVPTDSYYVETQPGYPNPGIGYRGTDGQKVINSVFSAYGATYNTTDTVALLFDADNLILRFYKNNLDQGSISVAAGSYTVAVGYQTTGAGVAKINFGQRPFAYTPPTGFLALNTQNLPASTIENGANYMAATLYTGNGTGQSINNTVNNVSFQPDLVWGKSRSLATNNNLYDSVRGTQKLLLSNGTTAELTGGELIAFTSNGFTLGANVYQMNQSGSSMVAWQWKAGGAAVTNTAGILTSQVSANTSAGFSVCTYTAPASSQANSFGHGLGIAPSMVIAKNRSSGTGGLGWAVYHISLGAGKYLTLNSTAAATTSAGYWGSGMTSTVVGLPTAASSTGFDNCTGNMVAYCFAEVAGYSKFGSYVGNGSTDGTFVYLGFRPRFVMIKRTDSTGNWAIWDTARDTFNATKYELVPNASDAETSAAGDRMDILSNGFKLRNSGITYNANGGTFVYACFAENPFKNALAR